MCSAQSIHILCGNCWGTQVFSPLLEEFTLMKHKQVFLFSCHQYWLQIEIFLCSFHKVLHRHMALDGTLYLKN